ncbi:response regulator transcription factor [Arcobacter sp. YIC-464]|uniref:response regulator transcription factor n=1 Tax=Arcobacter sp. YIC-464 TaxID=3376631 RepID=UPI003C148262
MTEDNIKLYHEILKKLCILYIEDEENIRNNMKKVLLLLCENVYDVQNITEANEIIQEKRVDIIISDINLPGQNGLCFVEGIRQINKKIPVILLSAYTETDYLLKATKLRLIDYLTKPVDFETLNTALLKCVEDIYENGMFIINFNNGIEYNVLNKKLEDINKNEIKLTSKELLLLDYLIKNSSRIISQDELKANIWDDLYEATDSALKNLLNKLRKKIGKESVSNISGVGYKLNI